MEPSRILWQKDGVFAAKRIPGILFTPAGTVLWWCEARDTLSDWARIDLQLVRSEDGGKTFSEPMALASGNAEHPTVNNPVLIAGRDGTLFFLYCRDYSVDGGDVFLRMSRDDGRTWTEPRDLMSSTRPAEHNAFAIGPGHGIETPDGTLLCPIWYVKKSAGMEPRSHHPAVVSSFFSRDGGGSWTLGEEIPATADCPDPNETAAAILSDGSVYFNVRLTGAGVRGETRSMTGTEGFSPLSPIPEMPDPTCMGSVISLRIGGRHVLISSNCASRTERKHLTLRASFDDGRTWPKSLEIEPGDAGYSDLALIPGDDPAILVVYEQRFGETLRLARVPLADLL